jgi:predicted ATPase
VKNARITIKNYRGFTDEEPATFEIGEGFTAFLGKNNAGKSSAKLLFYELRPLFGNLLQMNAQSAPGFFQLLGGGFHDFNYPGVTDPEELFNNRNPRPISIEIEVVGATPIAAHRNWITKIVLRADRSPPQRWTMVAYGGNGQPIHSPQGWVTTEPRIAHSPDRQIEVEALQIAEVLEALFGARYYGPFRNAINVGGTDHYDLKTGTSFIDLWNTWKTSGVKAQTRAIGQVTEDIRRLFEFEQLEINASTSVHTLMVTIDRQTYRLAELGSGIAQFIMVLGNAATTRPTIVLIDEPETNLHPSLQIDFLLALAQYATVGCVFSTHSVGLARSVAQRIYSFQKGERGPLVRPFEATPNYIEFLGELSFSVFKEMGHDRLLLVEGVNDVKAMQQLLRLVKKEHTTVILPLGGNQLAASGRELELGELTRLSNNILAVVDSERTADGSPPTERRRAFAETCNKLGIKVCLTDRRALENYFTDRAVKAAFGDAFSALRPYQLLKDAPNPWSKSDNWKVARQMTIADLAETDLGTFIQSV